MIPVACVFSHDEDVGIFLNLGFGYDFETTSKITELSLKAVKPDGKLLARVKPLRVFLT